MPRNEHSGNRFLICWVTCWVKCESNIHRLSQCKSCYRWLRFGCESVTRSPCSNSSWTLRSLTSNSPVYWVGFKHKVNEVNSIAASRLVVGHSLLCPEGFYMAVNEVSLPLVAFIRYQTGENGTTLNFPMRNAHVHIPLQNIFLRHALMNTTPVRMSVSLCLWPAFRRAVVFLNVPQCGLIPQ